MIVDRKPQQSFLSYRIHSVCWGSWVVPGSGESDLSVRLGIKSCSSCSMTVMVSTWDLQTFRHFNDANKTLLGDLRVEQYS